MKRSMVNAERYDYGDMTAAMIVSPPTQAPHHKTHPTHHSCWQITNGFEFYFEEMSFWGMNVDAHDCEDATTRNASRCHGAPSVILRGVGAPNTTGFPLDGLLSLPHGDGAQLDGAARRGRDAVRLHDPVRAHTLRLRRCPVPAVGVSAATVGSGCGCCRA